MGDVIHDYRFSQFNHKPCQQLLLKNKQLLQCVYCASYRPSDVPESLVLRPTCVFETVGVNQRVNKKSYIRNDIPIRNNGRGTVWRNKA